MKQNSPFKKTNCKYLLILLMINFIGATSFSQTLNYTIDTAVDNKTTITETIVSGTDSYELTIDHPGNKILFDLGNIGGVMVT